MEVGIYDMIFHSRTALISFVRPSKSFKKPIQNWISPRQRFRKEADLKLCNFAKSRVLAYET